LLTEEASIDLVKEKTVNCNCNIIEKNEQVFELIVIEDEDSKKVHFSGRH